MYVCIYIQYNTVNLTSKGTDEKMSDPPCCRINRGKMHYEDTEGTENKLFTLPKKMALVIGQIV